MCITHLGPSESPLWDPGAEGELAPAGRSHCLLGWTKPSVSNPGIPCLLAAPRQQEEANLFVCREGKILAPSWFLTVYEVTSFLVLPGWVLMCPFSHRGMDA